MDLKKEQKRYRVYLEDGASPQQVDVWRYYELRGTYGQICPYSESHLGIQITSPKIANRIKRLTTIGLVGQYPIIQDADDMTVFKVPNDKLEFFALLLNCRKKRIVSDSERVRLAELSKKHGFKVKSSPVKG